MGVLARVAEVVAKLRVATRIEVVIEEVGKVVERCIEVMADCARGLLPHPQIQEQGEQEDRVDDGGRWREEVVVGLRHELAHLVNEQADPDSGEHGAGLERPSVGEQQRA